jgi:Ricin-type beta-trefoil lectin domain
MFASSISRVRMVVTFAIAVLMALTMAVFVAAPAHAVGPQWVNKATQLCLDGSISQGVRLEPCNPYEYQEWTVLPAAGSDYVVFYHAATRLCLDGSISVGVRLNTCNDSIYQRWEVRYGSNAMALLNAATRACLDGGISDGVRLKRCNNSDYQRWY